MATEDPHGGRRIVSNGMWAAVQQAFSTGANAVFGLLLIAVLPVEQYGAYAYGVALAAMGMTFMSAGLTGLAVKSLVNEPDKNAPIVTSLLLIRETFALVAYIIVAIVSATSGQSLTVIATLIACIAIFGRAGDAPEMWFSSRMRTPEVARIRIVLTLVVAAVRIVGLIGDYPVWFFLVVFASEGLLSGAVIMTKYLRDRETPGLGKPDLARTRRLTRQSVPLVISGIANQINLRSDIVIIQAMLGLTSVAVYSSAARLSEIAYFLPVVFMNATLPVLLRIRKQEGANSNAYKSMLQRSYDRAFWFGCLTAVIVVAVGIPVIDLLLGDEYEGAKTVLAVHVLACPFVFMAAVYSKWVIAEGRLWLSVIRNIAGAAVNVALNLALLPWLGILGAAIATVGSYVLASYVACFFDRASRPAAIQMSLAIIAPLRWLRNRWRRPASSGDIEQ